MWTRNNRIAAYWTTLAAMLALIGLPAQECLANFMLFGTDELTVSTDHYIGELWDMSHASIVSGGHVDYIWAYHSSTVDIFSGGSVDYVFAYDSSAVDIFSGGYAYKVQAYHSSAVNIDDDGDVGDLLYAYGSSTVDISGGSVNDLHACDSSAADISGGTVYRLYAHDLTTVTFWGRNFNLSGGLTFDGERILGTGYLGGEWMNGDPWTTIIAGNDSEATILAVPEPATLALLALGGLALIARRRRRA